MVRCLCREPRRRPHRVTGRLPGEQPQPARVRPPATARRFPLNRSAHHASCLGLRLDGLQRRATLKWAAGKTERIVASAIASIAATLAKLAFDACLFNSQNFAFIKLPDAFTTGSSIMPHKKNPDVFELTRAKCNKLQALPYQITLIANNLPSGYFRDLQIIKEVFLPSFDELEECLDMVDLMMFSNYRQ